jgi:hypothetical protein
MGVTLAKALVGLVLDSTLFSVCLLRFVRVKAPSSFLQLFGAGCLVITVITHICEALHLFLWMQWGQDDSVGHYLDFWSAVLGLTLFPVGYALAKRRSARPQSLSLSRGAAAATHDAGEGCQMAVRGGDTRPHHVFASRSRQARSFRCLLRGLCQLAQ